MLAYKARAYDNKMCSSVSGKFVLLWNTHWYLLCLIIGCRTIYCFANLALRSYLLVSYTAP